MRLHSNVITPQQILDALMAEQNAGRIAPSVRFKTRTQHNSQSHAWAYEIQLEATSPGQGRRAGNSGSYGAMSPDVDNYAATFDEWGWLMATLYRIDPDAVWGSVKRPSYANAAHFHELTGLTYAPEALLDWIEQHHDPYPYQHRAQVGRYGAGRKSEDDAYPGYDVYRPRTAEWVRQFAHLTPVNA